MHADEEAMCFWLEAAGRQAWGPSRPASLHHLLARRKTTLARLQLAGTGQMADLPLPSAMQIKK